MLAALLESESPNHTVVWPVLGMATIAIAHGNLRMLQRSRNQVHGVIYVETPSMPTSSGEDVDVK